VAVDIIKSIQVSKLSIASIKNQQYTGSEIEPALTVKYASQVLTGVKESEYVEGESQADYTYSYENNIAVGTATVIITGRGDYTGTRKVTFKIVGVSITSAKVSGLISSYIYTGAPITQDEVSLTYASTALEEGTDYTVSYQNNEKVGKATVIFTGKGRYTGTLKKTFTITAYDLNKDIDGKISVEYDSSVVYAKGGSKPVPKVYYNEKLLESGKDYTVTYANNTSVNDGSNSRKIPYLVITGKGNFSGKCQKTFIIECQDISNLTATIADKLYTNKKNNYQATPVITDLDGKTLKAGTDYDNKNIQYYNADEEKITEASIIPVGTTIKAVINGKGNYTGLITAEYRIVSCDISKASATIKNQYYTGREVKPKKGQITITYKGKTLSSKDYEIVEYYDNVEKGTAKVIINGLGDYGGTKTITFKIVARQYVEIAEDTVPKGKYYTPQMYESYDDEDDTASFNRAIKALGGTCNTLYVPEGDYYIDAGVSIVLKSNMNLVMSPNARIIANANSRTKYDIIVASAVKNVTISGGQIIGDRYSHTGTSGEWGMGIGIYDGTNITISDVVVSDCWGDGIYLGSGNGQDSSASTKNVTIQNCTLKNNRRNNLSIVCADYVTIDKSSFIKANGTNPQYGICIETNYDTNPNEHIIIANSTFENNAEAAIGIVRAADDILVSDCVISGDVINYSGTNMSLARCTVKGVLYARVSVSLEDTTLNSGSSKQDTLVASYSASQTGYSVYGKDLSSSNKMSYSIVNDADSSCNKALKLTRTSQGSGEAGYYLKLSEITNNKMTSLKANTTYRFEYVVKGTGKWRFKTSQTAQYECVPSSDEFCTGTVTYKTNSTASCDLIFYAVDKTAGMYLEIESIKIYEVN
jgi:hypothetical protein